jgi:glutathione S-transferase
MDVYFSPFACSMASRIALYEADAQARFIEVDLRTKRTLGGEDFLAVNPLGQVPPSARTTARVLTQNPAVLQYIAERHPAAAWHRRAGWSGCASAMAVLHRHRAAQGDILAILRSQRPGWQEPRIRKGQPSPGQYLNNHLTRTGIPVPHSSALRTHIHRLNWYMVTPVD